MPDLLRAPGELRRWVAALSDDGRRLTAEEREALTEAAFRLAVHPETHPDEAVELLAGCAARDPANLRYAFHLGRIGLARGDLAAARAWLGRAVALCPTSHRAWAQLALLQWELNGRYAGLADEFEPDALKDRGDAIVEAIRAGRDEFRPDLAETVRPKPRRVASSGSGTTGRPGTRLGRRPPAWRGRRRAAGRLPASGGRTDRGSVGGPASMTWFWSDSWRRPGQGRAARAPSGSPGRPARGPGASRRSPSPGCSGWSPGIPPRPSAASAASFRRSPRSRRRSNCSTRCATWPRPRTPRSGGQLAAALAGGRLPPLLAALLHRQRLVPAVEYRALGTFRAACQLLADRPRESDDEASRAVQTRRANQLAASLVDNLNALVKPPPKPLADVAPEAKSAPLAAADVRARLDDLNRSATALQSLFDRTFRFLSQVLVPLAKAGGAAPQAARDRAALGAVLALFNQRGEAGVARAAEVEKDFPRLPPGPELEEFGRLRETADNGFKRLGSQGKFARLCQQIDALPAAPPGGTAADPSPELGGIVAATREQLAQLAAAPATAADAPPDAALKLLEEHAAAVEAVWNDGFAFLEKGIAAVVSSEDGAALPQAVADRRAYDQLVAAFEAVGKEGAGRVDVLGGEVRTHGDRLPGDFPARAEACRNRFNTFVNPGKFRNQLRKIDGQLGARPAVAPAANPSPDVARWLGLLGAIFPPPAPPAGEPATAPPVALPLPPLTAPQTGLTGLAAVVRETVARIDRVFDEAVGRFGAYPAWARALPPLRVLADSLRARQAELLYRLGRRTDARRLWADLLRADRLSPGLLKNLAVCDTGDPDPARAAASWQAFAEVLYFYDVVLGDPRKHARARIDLHCVLGRAGVPAFLFDSKDEEGSDRTRQLITFVNGAGRVGHFVDHHLLEFLNTQFEATSPLVALGVSRSDPTDRRKRAADRLTAFAATAAGRLPDRVREGFAALAARHFADTLAACKDARRLLHTRDTAYDAEKDGHIHRLWEVVRLKLTLHNLLLDPKTLAALVREMNSVAFVEELVRLDAVPLDLSDEFITPVADAIKASPEAVQGLLGNLALAILSGVMDFLFGAEETEEAAQDRQYRRLVGRWVRSPGLAKYLRLIERPQHWYPEAALQALQTGKVTVEAVEVLRRLHDRYPALTGIARDLADVLCTDPKKMAEAADLLEAAAEVGFRPDGCRQARHAAARLRARAALEAEQFDRARELALKLLAEGEPELQDAHLVVTAFLEEGRHRKADPGVRQLRAALAAWLERARGRLAAWEKTDEEPQPPFTEKDLDGIDTVGERVTTELVLTAAGLVGQYREGGFVCRLLTAVVGQGEPDWAKAESELSRLIRHLDARHAEPGTKDARARELLLAARALQPDPARSDLADALYYRMIAQLRQANAAFKMPALQRSHLDGVRRDAERLVPIGSAEQQRTAQELIAQIPN